MLVLGAGNYTEDGGTLTACRKKRPRTGKYSTLVIIPRDIIFKILLLVPAKVLIEIARFVCKEWNAIMTDPSFIIAHFLHWSSSPGNVGLLFQEENRNDAKQKLAFYLHPGSDIELPIPAKILSSCNGLVLLHSAKSGREFFFSSRANRRELFVVNLITKAKIILPPLPGGVYILDTPYSALGFAPCSGQYKVVYVTLASKNNRTPFVKASTMSTRVFELQPRLFICTVGVDETWRTIDCESVFRGYGGKGALMGGPPFPNGGSIYWLDRYWFNYGLVLDLDAETLHPFTGPITTCRQHKQKAYVIKLDTGGVGVVYDAGTNDKGDNIWKVVELIVSKSKSGTWGEPVVVYPDVIYDQLQKQFPCCDVGPFRPLLFSFEKQELWLSILVNDQYALFCYNWKTGSSSRYAPASDRPWSSHVTMPHLHINTLLSPNTLQL